MKVCRIFIASSDEMKHALGMVRTWCSTRARTLIYRFGSDPNPRSFRPSKPQLNNRLSCEGNSVNIHVQQSQIDTQQTRLPVIEDNSDFGRKFHIDIIITYY